MKKSDFNKLLGDGRATFQTLTGEDFVGGAENTSKV